MAQLPIKCVKQTLQLVKQLTLPVNIIFMPVFPLLCVLNFLHLSGIKSNECIDGKGYGPPKCDRHDLVESSPACADSDDCEYRSCCLLSRYSVPTARERLFIDPGELGGRSLFSHRGIN